MERSLVSLWLRAKFIVLVIKNLLVISCCSIPFPTRLVPILSWLTAAENMVCCVNECEPDV